ncbi:Galactose oxidase [Tolypocladium ophioglossoides CBS 100239]|uniref:Galactose oxidase n=1 Tax=Tolypocladium ophioglossoides (strain CBS 100239) TaxID=1163406 RepID=A0A0L0MXD9_TOLOC|nr:Galactose oxidase [Tolypocladium ophioglossoides CBS 100239]
MGQAGCRQEPSARKARKNSQTLSPSVFDVYLVSISEAFGNPQVSIANLNIYRAGTDPTPSNGLERWGPTLNFSIVLVTGAVEPQPGKVLVWSLNGSPGGFTRTLALTRGPATGDVTGRNITNIRRDMFSPGMDGSGQIVVTEGSEA